MTNPEALKQSEDMTSKQVQFLNAFANIAQKEISKFHNSTHKEVKKPHLLKEENK
ncbi:hypothetical protein [Oceanobacillus kapialis]|uniref:Uncharacterized protein n=1 Tax=Oceanobacillus kapialis TaxID=481353 RepID=A0ABW5PVP2_9BACI